MGANANNAFYFLVTTLLNLYLGAVLLRILLQWVHADFYNPISQAIYKITQPPLTPLHKVIPRWRALDTAAALLLVVLCYAYIEIVVWMIGVSVGTISALGFALLKIVVLAISLYTITLFAQAILSWVGPGVSNPASNILWSINEPLLRPVRRLIPPIAGLDLSPLFVLLALQVLSRLIPLPGAFR